MYTKVRQKQLANGRPLTPLNSKEQLDVNDPTQNSVINSGMVVAKQKHEILGTPVIDMKWSKSKKSQTNSSGSSSSKPLEESRVELGETVPAQGAHLLDASSHRARSSSLPISDFYEEKPIDEPKQGDNLISSSPMSFFASQNKQQSLPVSPPNKNRRHSPPSSPPDVYTLANIMRVCQESAIDPHYAGTFTAAYFAVPTHTVSGYFPRSQQCESEQEHPVILSPM